MTFEIPKNWTFHSDHVAEHFDAHVREQLPWYDLVTSAIVEIARHFIPDGGLIYDIGASTGNIGRSLADTIDAKNAQLIAIEKSSSMAERYAGPGKLVVCDACAHDYEPFDVAILFLVLMFIPVSKRGDLIKRLYAKLKPGGAIIIVEKTIPPGGWLSTVFSRLTLRGKLLQGALPEKIIEKEMSLAGSQRPIDKDTLAGDPVEFFRFGDFAGFIIEKKEGAGYSI